MTYSSEVLADSPLYWLKLDESTTFLPLTVVPDQSGAAGSVIYHTPVTVNGLSLSFTTSISGGDGISLAFLDPAQCNQYSLGNSGGDRGFIPLAGSCFGLDSFGGVARWIYNATLGGGGSVQQSHSDTLTGTISWVVSMTKTATNTYTVTITKNGSAYQTWVGVTCPDTAYLGFTAGNGGAHGLDQITAMSGFPSTVGTDWECNGWAGYAATATMADSSGNSRDFTLVAGARGQAPVRSSALASLGLSGTTAWYVSHAYASWMDVADFSYETWFVAKDSSTLNCLGSRDWSSPRGWQLYVESGNITVYDSNSARFASTTTIAVGSKYHAVITYNSSTQTLKLYLNKVLDTTWTGVVITNTIGTFDFTVGVSHAGTSGGLYYPFNGHLNDTAYYPSILSSTRVAAHYDAQYTTVKSVTTVINTGYVWNGTASATVNSATHVLADWQKHAVLNSVTTVSCTAFITGAILPASATIHSKSTITVVVAVNGVYMDTAVVASTTAISTFANGPLVSEATVNSTSTVYVSAFSQTTILIDPINSITTIYLIYTPDLSDNEPIYAAFSAHGDLAVTPPRPLAITDTELSERATPGLTMTLSDPVVVRGIPMLPKYRAVYPTTITPLVGPTHIHFVPDPNPVWNPATSGWFTPPPPTANPLVGRWTVDDLPDPSHYPDNYYWLGDPTSADGTASIQSAARQWAPNGSTPHAPTWHSFFPFKPSVRSYDSFLPGGNVVHHPKGVHFNSQYIEHMWMNWGRVMRQPFTWCIAAMIVSNPEPGFTHYILDAGKDPDTTGFPRITAEQCNNDYRINDSLSYRNLLAVSPTQEFASARTDVHTAGVVRGRFNSYIKPMMYWTIFNGTSSYVGAWGTGGKRQQRGTLDNSANYKHQLYVMGRPQGWISQSRSSHIMVFEMRYWDKNLSIAELNTQYNQLSSTYKFGEYRAV